MMEGETSQNTVTGGMFDGEPDLNWSEDAVEGEETETSADAQKPVPEAKEPEKAEENDFLVIRYNKADRKLTKAEAVELAQKGATMTTSRANWTAIAMVLSAKPSRLTLTQQACQSRSMLR